MTGSSKALIALCLVLFLLGGFGPVAQGKQSKGAKAGHGSRHYGSGNYLSRNYLVPPPPAYIPAWLPESQYRSSVTPVKTQPANSSNSDTQYAKYIYTAPGHERTAPIQPNKYVTYWSKT